MKHTIQVRIYRGDSKYVAECLDLPVVTQGNTLDEATANIREAIQLHLEGENLEGLGFSTSPTVVARNLALAPDWHCAGGLTSSAS